MRVEFGNSDLMKLVFLRNLNFIQGLILFTRNASTISDVVSLESGQEVFLNRRLGNAHNIFEFGPSCRIHCLHAEKPQVPKIGQVSVRFVDVSENWE